MTKKKEQQTQENQNVWPAAIAIVGVLLVASLGFNVFYAVTLSQNADLNVASTNTTKNSSRTSDAEPVDVAPEQYGEIEQTEDDAEILEAGDDDDDTETMTAREREIMNIIEEKRKKLGQNDWKCVSVYLDAKNSDNTKYFVYYTARDKDGDEEEFVTLLEKKNGEWKMKLPGYDMADELVYEAYGLKMVD